MNRIQEETRIIEIFYIIKKRIQYMKFRYGSLKFVESVQSVPM
ncbi:hypothetical protein [Methanobacterium sp. MBAC-LM]